MQNEKLNDRFYCTQKNELKNVLSSIKSLTTEYPKLTQKQKEKLLVRIILI